MINRTVVNRSGGFVRGMITYERGQLSRPGHASLLAKHLALSFRQHVTRLYEVAQHRPTRFTYFSGPTEGSLTADRLLGSCGSIRALFMTYQGVCKVGENVINLMPQGGRSLHDADGATYRLEGCVINNVSSAVAVEAVVCCDNTTLAVSSVIARTV